MVHAVHVVHGLHVRVHPGSASRISIAKISKRIAIGLIPMENNSPATSEQLTDERSKKLLFHE